MSDKLLEPPEAAIMTGYSLNRAASYLDGPDYANADWYILQAIKCIDTAIPKIRKRTDMFYFEPGWAQQLINEVADDVIGKETTPFKRRGSAGKLRHAHELLADMMKRHGYREITSRDFAKLGDGGGR
ncbi:MAG: hypothetical protein QNJ62_06150 [Methyloceanibacter sp.]|nr:hypothetical protein [Methyloceanibacter sp.]